MSDPRDSLHLMDVPLTYAETRRLKRLLKNPPQYDGLDPLRERLFIGNGLDPDPEQYPHVYGRRCPKKPPVRGRWRVRGR